jgi:hypothetical protein
MPNSVLPPKLQGTKHWDWPWPFSKVPRAWTSFDWGVPVKVAGNQTEVRKDQKKQIYGPAPIGEAGSWQVSRFPGAPGILKYIPMYLAFTLPGGRHVRIGARWDDVDSYVTVPTVASRKYSGDPNENTGTGPFKDPGK